MFPSFPADHNTESSSKTQRGVRQGAAFGPRCGNAPSRGAAPASKKEAKGSKRKQVDVDQDSAAENQPPTKKCPPGVPGKIPAKNLTNKGQSKKKLISGQGKLTSFFRL